MPSTNCDLFVPLVQVYLYSIAVQRLKLYNMLCILPLACFKTCLNELFSSTSVLVELEQLRIGKFLEQWECRWEWLALSPPLWMVVGALAMAVLARDCLTLLMFMDFKLLHPLHVTLNYRFVRNILLLKWCLSKGLQASIYSNLPFCEE